MLEDGRADEACRASEDEMHFADRWRNLMVGRNRFREELIKGKGDRGTLSWALCVEGVAEMQRSKAEVRECGEAAASVHGQNPRVAGAGKQAADADAFSQPLSSSFVEGP